MEEAEGPITPKKEYGIFFGLKDVDQYFFPRIFGFLPQNIRYFSDFLQGIKQCCG